MEKLVFALVISSRKLRQYFQGRLIIVMTNQPLRGVQHRPDMSGRLALWTIELSQFHLKFQPRTSMKSQSLADFITRCTFSNSEQGEIMSNTDDKAWTLFTDGSSTSQAMEAGIILTGPEGVHCTSNPKVQIQHNQQ